MAPVWQVAPHPDASDRESPGNFREHDIHPFDDGMTPPSWPLVPTMMRDWLDLAKATGSRLRDPSHGPLPEQLAVLHNKFEMVHPFIDGNGRAGRLVLNLVLVRLGYPPIVIMKRQRPAYLTAMQRADDGDPGGDLDDLELTQVAEMLRRVRAGLAATADRTRPGSYRAASAVPSCTG